MVSNNSQWNGVLRHLPFARLQGTPELEVPRNWYVYSAEHKAGIDYASDIDENNVRTSQQNVELNQLESRIRIIQTDPKEYLFPLEQFGQKR